VLRVNTLIAQAFDPMTLRLTGELIPIAEQVERTPGSHRGAFSISRTGVLAYRPIGETHLATREISTSSVQTVSVFLFNQPSAGTPSSPITLVVNWPALLKK